MMAAVARARGARLSEETRLSELPPGSWSYVVFPAHGLQERQDPWAALTDMVTNEGRPDAYWSARAFGLNGRLELQLDDQVRLVWGGPLIDLASALADWLSAKPVTFRFEPLEQAASIDIVTELGRSSFRIGGVAQGTLAVRTATASVREFIDGFADEIVSRVPELASIDELSWLRGSTDARGKESLNS